MQLPEGTHIPVYGVSQDLVFREPLPATVGTESLSFNIQWTRDECMDTPPLAGGLMQHNTIQTLHLRCTDLAGRVSDYCSGSQYSGEHSQTGIDSEQFSSLSNQVEKIDTQRECFEVSQTDSSKI